MATESSIALEDPLLSVTPSGGTGINDPTTMTTRPITNRFAKGAPPRAQQRREPDPPPSDRFTLPPPPPPKRTGGLEDDLDLQFDDASDLDAAARLPKGRPEEEAKAPAGVEGDSGEYKLEGKGAYRDPAAAGRRASEAKREPEKRAPEKRAPEAKREPEKRAPEAKRRPEKGAPEEGPELMKEEEDSLSSSSSSSTRPATQRLDPADLDEISSGDLVSSDVASLAKSGHVEDILDGPTTTPVIEKGGAKKPSESEMISLDPLEESDARPAMKAKAPAPASEIDEDAFLEDEPAAKPAPSPAAKPAKKKGSDDELLKSDSDPLPTPGPIPRRPVEAAKEKPKSKTRVPDESDFEGALGLFGTGDEAPLDSKPRSREAARAGRGDDVPEIAPLDLATQVAKGPTAGKEKKGKPESPFEVRPASAILEPLDPNQAKAILKTQKADEVEDKDDAREPSGDLEPLDPNEALAILGTDDAAGKKPQQKKPLKHKDGRPPSKVVPLSASDEDFDFLDKKAKSKGADAAPPPKKTDPFLKAARALDEGQARPEKPVMKKTERLTPEAAAARKPAPRAEPPAPKSVDGDGDHGLVLSRITTPTRRQRAAEIIAEIRGIPVDEAMRLCDRTIIPVLKGVTKELAEQHLEVFKQNKISGRVTTRQAREK